MAGDRRSEPIDPPARVGAKGVVRQRVWDQTDTMLYALGVGAGGTDPLLDLPLTTENSRNTELLALPTMAAVLASSPELMALVTPAHRSTTIHASCELAIRHTIHPSGKLDISDEVVAVIDKGPAGAAFVTVLSTAAKPGGTTVFTRRSTMCLPAAGGFGGEARGPVPTLMPRRPPDRIFTDHTANNQALLYRLSGDRNPLHSDPFVAQQLTGSPRPILHGLCTYGFAGRALLHDWCDDRPDRVRLIAARFGAPVYPGDVLETRSWCVEPGKLLFEMVATTGSEVGRTVLTSGRLNIGPPEAGTGPPQKS